MLRVEEMIEMADRETEVPIHGYMEEKRRQTQHQIDLTLAGVAHAGAEHRVRRLTTRGT